MKAFWASFRDFFAMLSLRERVLFFIAICGVFLIVWYFLMWRGVASTRHNNGVLINSANQEVVSLQGELVALQGQSQQIKANQGPQEEQELQERMKQLDQLIQSLDRQVIAPTKMVEVLRDLLQQSYGLSLERLKNGPVKLLHQFGANYKIYEHGMTIVIKGNFFSTLNFLKSLEQLKWNLFWDKISYSVETYPEAEVTLNFHTLSTKEGWINV